jgi:hypothetical protein
VARGSLASGENVKSPRLPGGSLISAALDRHLMVWSDRGGASGGIGDGWAARCAQALSQAVGSERSGTSGQRYRLVQVLRLDELPAVTLEANHHQLPNPDFLLLGIESDSRQPVLQAADAKFAADRIKPSQVSVEVVSNLLTVPETGATRQLVDAALEEHGLPAPVLEPGLFLCPDSVLTDYLLRSGRDAPPGDLEPAVIERVPPDPATMFQAYPMSPLIGTFARIDALPVTPRANLLSAVYYFRLACAAFYFWNEATRPLLTNGRERAEPEIGLVAAEISRRSAGARSAWNVIEGWETDVASTIAARKAVREAAHLPISMLELRRLAEDAGWTEERGSLRALRRNLELTFLDEIVARTGEIMPNDPRPLDTLLKRVARASRELRPVMRERAEELARVPAENQGN